MGTARTNPHSSGVQGTQDRQKTEDGNRHSQQVLRVQPRKQQSHWRGCCKPWPGCDCCALACLLDKCHQAPATGLAQNIWGPLIHCLLLPTQATDAVQHHIQPAIAHTGICRCEEACKRHGVCIFETQTPKALPSTCAHTTPACDAFDCQ